jgi:hypothetical protein
MSSAAHLSPCGGPMASAPRRCCAATCGPIRTNPTRRPRGAGTPAGRGGRRAHPGAAGRRPGRNEAGVPALLMNRLHGRVDWWPSDLDRWLERLAALLPRIHGTALPPGRGGPPLRPLPAGELPAARLGAVPAGVARAGRNPRSDCCRGQRPASCRLHADRSQLTTAPPGPGMARGPGSAS